MSESRDFHLDNSGNKRVRVPGFDDIPSDFEKPGGSRFAHGIKDLRAHSLPLRLTAKEMTMLRVMNSLTEEAQWDVQVLDKSQSTVLRQRFDDPLLSEKAWDWCLAELRDKAKEYAISKLVLVWNTESGICKSLNLIDEELRKSLETNCQSIWDVCSSRERRRSSSRHPLRHVVDPTMYPLVYGKTQVLLHGSLILGRKSVVEQRKVFIKSGKRQTYFHPEVSNQPKLRLDYQRETIYGSRVSSQFQCLPTEISFVSNSQKTKITSYINNLHPTTHESLYRNLESLVSLAIEPWNQVLIRTCPKAPNRVNWWPDPGLNGRTPVRIRTFGPSWAPELPEWVWGDERVGHLTLKDLEKMGDGPDEDIKGKVRTFLSLSEPDPRIRRYKEETLPSYSYRRGGVEMQTAIEQKRDRLSHFVHPEPGVSFSYEDWKAGRAGAAIIEKYEASRQCDKLDDDHDFYSISLRDDFSKQGLQVFVQISGIELTPEQPTYDSDHWRLDGLLNEHIVATALYCFDAENVRGSTMSFRHETCWDSPPYQYSGRWDNNWAAPLFGFEPEVESKRNGTQFSGPVGVSQGRLIAWPNTMAHRIDPFGLEDPLRPGHLRYVKLSLVDPNYRICSTRNVPPQQHDWWFEDVAQAADLYEKLPEELVCMIQKETEGYPMGMKEAQDIRAQVEEEREFLRKARDQQWDMNPLDPYDS
jgi:hypothetical protein